MVDKDDGRGVGADGGPAWAVHLPDGVDWRDVDLLEHGSLPGAWTRRWRAEPERPVVHDETSGWLTAGDLLARSARIAGRLAGAGLRRGDRVLLSGPATVEFVIAHVAAAAIGARRHPGQQLLHRPRAGGLDRHRRSGGRHPRLARPARRRTSCRRRTRDRRHRRRSPGASGPGARRPSPPPTPRCCRTRRAPPAGRRACCSPTATCWPARRRSGWPGDGPTRIASSWRCRCSTSTGSASACTARS